MKCRLVHPSPYFIKRIVPFFLLQFRVVT